MASNWNFYNDNLINLTVSYGMII